MLYLKRILACSPQCVSVLPQALQPYRAPCHRKGLILIPSKLLWDSIMQDNANTDSFKSVWLPTHTQDKKLKQHCLTLLFLSFLLICTFNELFVSVSEISGCKGNDIWEIIPRLMYNTTKTLPSNAASVSKALFALSSLSAALKVLPSWTPASGEVSQGPLDQKKRRSSNSV